MEFCQIQLNYLNWTFQDAKAKVELLNSYHIPVWVRELLRGGKLAKKHPSACIGCRSCEKVCPQQIRISEAMSDFAKKMQA